eukprot:5035101-Pyramimonas_sp.AAC.1
MKTSSGHLAIKVDEYGVAAEADGSTAPTLSSRRRPRSSRRPRIWSRLRGNLLLAARGRPLPPLPA